MTHLAPFERHGEVKFERPLLTAACSEGHLQPLRATHCLCGAAPPGEGRAAMQELTPASLGERVRSRMEDTRGPKTASVSFRRDFIESGGKSFWKDRLVLSACGRGVTPEGCPSPAAPLGGLRVGSRGTPFLAVCFTAKENVHGGRCRCS